MLRCRNISLLGVISPRLFALAHYVAFVNSPAGVCNVRSHQMFAGKLVSPASQPAIRRVAPCQTHTDWPSAENQLTYDLLAVIHIPLLLSPHPLGNSVAQGLAAVPNLSPSPFFPLWIKAKHAADISSIPLHKPAI